VARGRKKKSPQNAIPKTINIKKNTDNERNGNESPLYEWARGQTNKKKKLRRKREEIKTRAIHRK